MFKNHISYFESFLSISLSTFIGIFNFLIQFLVLHTLAISSLTCAVRILVSLKITEIGMCFHFNPRGGVWSGLRLSEVAEYGLPHALAEV